MVSKFYRVGLKVGSANNAVAMTVKIRAETHDEAFNNAQDEAKHLTTKLNKTVVVKSVVEA